MDREMRCMGAGLRRLLVAVGAATAATVGCQTFVAPESFRPFHAAEPLGVEFLHGGRIAQIRLRDGRPVQALALRLTRIADGSHWSGFKGGEDYKAILPGKRSLAEPIRGGIVPFLLPYDSTLSLERQLDSLKVNFEAGNAREIEGAFLDSIPGEQNSVAFLLACEGQTNEVCLKPSRAYTLVLRTTNRRQPRDNAAAHPFVVGRRSWPVSATGGLLFLLGIYAITIG